MGHLCICRAVTLATNWMGVRERKDWVETMKEWRDVGLVQDVVLWMGRYLGHKTRELSDSGCAQGEKREESKAAFWDPWWVASWVRGREEGLAGEGRLQDCPSG